MPNCLDNAKPNLIPLLVLLGGACGAGPGKGIPSAVDAAVPDGGEAAATGGSPDVALPPAIPYLPCRELEFPSDLKTLIQAKLAGYPDVPGIVVAVHHPVHGSVIAAFGTTAAGGKTPMPTGAVFDIGSVHKLFKWIMLEKLFEDGKITYSDAISDHVTSPPIAGATIRNLTDHSTGMVDIGENFYANVFNRFQGGMLPHDYSYAEMNDFLRTDTSANTTAGMINGFILGRQHNYSSYGPVVASQIAARVTGTDPLAYMRRHILVRLGLTNTSFIGFDPAPAALTPGHGSDDGLSATAPKTLPPGGIPRAVSSGAAGALFSTACDMLNFARDINDPAAGYLAAETITSRTATSIDIGGVYKVGRGVFNHRGFGAGDFWSHAGDGMSGHASLVGHNPSNGVSAAVHSNLRPKYIKNGHGLHWDIFGILSGYQWR